MTVTTYSVERDFTILDTLFLKGDTLYISNDYRDGYSSVNWRKVFMPDKKLLGTDSNYRDLDKNKYLCQI